MTNCSSTVLSNFWLDQALAEETGAAAAPPLDGDAKADVAIVGGGYTGLWTAIELKAREPGLDDDAARAHVLAGMKAGRRRLQAGNPQAGISRMSASRHGQGNREGSPPQSRGCRGRKAGGARRQKKRRPEAARVLLGRCQRKVEMIDAQTTLDNL